MKDEGDEKMDEIHIRKARKTQEHLSLSVDNEHLKSESALSKGHNLKIDSSKCKSTFKSVRILLGLSQDPRLRGVKEPSVNRIESIDAADSINNIYYDNYNINHSIRIINNKLFDDGSQYKRDKMERREPKNEILSRTFNFFTNKNLVRISIYFLVVWLMLNVQFGGVESVPAKRSGTASFNLSKESASSHRTLKNHRKGYGEVGERGNGKTKATAAEAAATAETALSAKVSAYDDHRPSKRQRQRHHHRHQNQMRQQNQEKKTVNKNCKEYDVTSRAFLSDLIFEGTARSRSRLASGRYITFVVHEILKQKNALVKPKTQIRLHFSGRRNSKRLSRINPLHDCPLNSINNGHRAMANLKIGENYYVFADQSGLMNYTARGEPIVVNRRNLKSIRSILSKKKERPPRVTGLKDLNLRATQALRLNCQVRGRPVPRINWYKNGVSLIPSSHVNITYYRRNSTVEIKSVELEDGGLYECRATSVTGRMAKISAHINVWKLYTPTGDQDKSFPTKKCSVDAYCLNGGQCYFVEDLGEHWCECAAGFKGARCELKEVSSIGIKSYICGFNVGYSSYYC